MTSLADEFASEFEGRRVLVTGATGFIGKNLCHALTALRANVTGLSRSAGTSNVPEGVVPLAADLRAYAEASKALGQADPELIFHLAGYVTASPDPMLMLPMFEANAVGTVNLLAAASELKCARLILVASAEALGAEGGPRSGSPYAASKLVAEMYGNLFHRLCGLPVVTLRLFLTYGPWQQPSKLIPYTILKLLRGEAPVLTSGERVCDVIYVEDVVRGLLKAAVAPDGVLGAQLDLGTGKGLTIRELVERVAQLVGSSVSPVFGGLPDRPNEAVALADVTRTRSLLGWSPRWSLEEGLRGTVRWYRRYAESGGPL